VQKVFSMKRPEQGESVVDTAVTDSQATVIALEAVNQPEVERDDQQYRQLRDFLAQMEGQREYQAYQQYLRDNAEIERN